MVIHIVGIFFRKRKFKHSCLCKILLYNGGEVMFGVTCLLLMSICWCRVRCFRRRVMLLMSVCYVFIVAVCSFVDRIFFNLNDTSMLPLSINLFLFLIFINATYNLVTSNQIVSDINSRFLFYVWWNTI